MQLSVVDRSVSSLILQECMAMSQASRADGDRWDRALRRAFESHFATGEVGIESPTPEFGGDEALPEQIDRYSVIDEVACGAIGVVLEIVDPELGRTLALKLLRREHRGNERVSARFVEEAQIAGQLQHPGVVPIHEVGQYLGRPYFTMKFVQGQTLADRLAERAPAGPNPIDLIVTFESVCQTLAYAHSRGVLHRDLKPANIMVGAFDEVQVMDWGLAKVVLARDIEESRSVGVPTQTDEPSITTFRSHDAALRSCDGSIVGTPAYMAPEQARGEIDAIDTRSDVFALGAILCEILTGAPPYDGRSSAEVHRRACAGDLNSARARLSKANVDSTLKELALNCLIADPNQRPRDGRAVTTTIQQYRRSLAERMRDAELAAQMADERAAHEKRLRRRNGQLLLTLGLALVIVVTSYGWIHQHRSREIAEKFDRLEHEYSVATNVDLSDSAVAASLDVRLTAAAHAHEWSLEFADYSVQHVVKVTGQSPAEIRARTYELHQSLLSDFNEREAEARLIRELGVLRVRALLDEDAGDINDEYDRAFRRYGLDFLLFDDPVLIERIQGSIESRAMVEAVEDWVSHLRLAGDSRWRRLLRIARRAEASEAESKLTAELLTNNRESILRRIDVDLASEETRWPASTVLLLAGFLDPVADSPTIERLYQWGVERYPQETRFHVKLAKLALEQDPQDFRTAVDHWTTATAIRPGDLSLRLRLAETLTRSGLHDAARNCYQRSVELHPHSADALSGYGRSLYKLKRLDESIEALEKAITKDSEHLFAHELLARAYGRADQWLDSCRAHERVAELQPLRSASHFSVGLARWQAGDYEASRAAYERAIELDPTNAGAQCNLASALLELGETELAIKSIRRGHRVGQALEKWNYPSHNYVKWVEEFQRHENALRASQPSGAEIEAARDYIGREGKAFPAAAARLMKQLLRVDEAYYETPVRRFAVAKMASLAGRFPAARPHLQRYRGMALTLLESVVSDFEELPEPSPSDLELLRQLRRESAFRVLRAPEIRTELTSETQLRCAELWRRVEAINWLATESGPR